MLILTGQRRGEVAGIEWPEVDMNTCRWEIPGAKSKNGRAHIVHLSKPAMQVIDTLPRFLEATFLFTTTGTTAISGFSKAKRQIDKVSGVSSWTLHDLRRSFATHATERLGADPQVVDRILNHVSGHVTGIAAVYQRGEYLEQRRDVLDRWSELVEAKAACRNELGE